MCTYPFAHVEEVGGSLLVAGVSLRVDGNVDVTPVDGLEKEKISFVNHATFAWKILN